MNHARTTREAHPPRQLTAQRRAAGLVAQYIHELSNRHGRERRRRAVPQRPPLELNAIQPCEGG